MKTAAIGIALGESTATATWRHGGRNHVERIPLPAGACTDAAKLGDVFSTIRERVSAMPGGQRVAATVALLPPLSDARALRLPPLRAAEAQAVVARDAGRWFIGVPAPRAVSVQTPKHSAHATFAAAAAEQVVAAVADAARTSGIALRGIVPAHAAWLAAAPAAGTVVATHEGILHVLQRADGAVAAVRRFAADDVAQAAAAGAEPRRDAVVLDDGSAAAHGFARAGWSVTTSGAADAAAARFAADARCRFEGAAMIAERTQRSRRAALSFAAAACCLLLAAAALHLWGAQRELSAVRERRAEIRSEVAPLLALRDSVDRVSEHTARIDSLAAAAPRWTEALFDIALLLPPESHLTRLFASGDTLLIDAQGERAGEALQALRAAGTLRDARLVGAVDRELADGATTVERFRLRARLASRATDVVSTARADSAGAAP